MTPEEKHLWYDFLKRLPVTVKRQYVIGNYIVDFLIFSKKMIIEIDGRQHGLPENKEADIERDEKLRQMGFTVFRYTNEQINTNFRGVAADILNHLGLTMSDLKKGNIRIPSCIKKLLIRFQDGKPVKRLYRFNGFGRGVSSVGFADTFPGGEGKSRSPFPVSGKANVNTAFASAPHPSPVRATPWLAAGEACPCRGRHCQRLSIEQCL
ncbi:MAG: DUF559 domain-containing protein [Clostridia bacterium]|nr:DUF559 domain-containing protein [Clostridia bacterium]MBP5269436.1 DUF559 domain-containing protein [Clostridia bacterium]